MVQQQAEEAAKKKREEMRSTYADKMQKELDQFSVTLNKKHFENAVQLRSDAKDAGIEDLAIKVHTKDIYQKSFTFPQIAHNDYAVEQFEALNIAEQNLNNDPSNDQ